MVESTAKLREEIMALTGVDIMLNNDTFKSTYQIMDELAAKWQDLTDIQQASVTELIAGKRQGNIVSSLMTNFDTAREALDTSLNSSGSALREHAKWSESLEARLNKLKSTWQSLSQTFMSSDFLKGGLDLVIGFVNALDKLIDTIGILGVSIAGLGIKKIFSTAKGVGGLKSLTDILPLLSTAFPNAAKGVGVFTTALKGGVGIVGVLKAALSGLWTVVAAHPILAVVAAVGLGIAAFARWHESASELAERVDELTSKYKEQHTELVKNKSSFESQATRYAQLAKGVGTLGENVSLTADEYAEYQEIVNSIANQVPSLVKGYDAQGNAILDYTGNVKELTAAYEELIKAQNNSILIDNYKDIEKDFKNAMDDADSGGWKRKSNTEGIKSLEEMLDNNYSREEIEKKLYNSGNIVNIANALKDAGFESEKFDIHWWSSTDAYYDYIADAIENSPDIVRKAISKFEKELDEEAEGMRTAAQAALSKAFDFSDSEYKNISDKTQSLIRQIVGNFDAEQFDKIVDSGKTVEQYINDMLDSFKSMSKGEATQLETAFDLQTKFNGGDISYGEYIQGIKNAEELIDGLNIDDEVKNQIKLTLDTEEIQNNYDALKNRLTSEEFGIKMSTKEAEKYLSELSASEYQVAINLIDDKDIDFNDFDSIKELRAYIEKQAKLNDALNYTIPIDVETESIEALNTAMAESVSGAGLSSEAIAALKSRYAELEGEGYNLSAMFEETANGIHLNKEAVNELEQKLASDKLAETDKQLGVLKNRYDELTTEIDNCRDASDRAALYTEQQSIVDKINDLATLASQYQGLTSAYNAWIAAEESGSERDMYESMLEGFESIGDEISRGWLDDGTIEFLKLIRGEKATIVDGNGVAKEIDIATASAKELKQVWNDLDGTIKNTSYSVKDFFTVDEDGNSTSQGVWNFLDAVGQLEEEEFDGKDVVKRDKDGNIIEFDFKVAGGEKAVADALGISEELVQIMLRAADDAGFVVNLEGAYTQLADLKTEAESARDTLISLQKNGLAKLKGVDVNFNLDAEGNDLLEEQGKAVELLNKFKDKNGKIDLKMEGAQQALDIAEYLTIKLDDLTEPKIMQIDVSEVDEDLRDPIEKMQEIVNLSKEKNLVSLTGDKKEIQETQNEINKVAEELEELDPEIKAKVGIDEDWDAKTIASKIEKGEVEIPAELELDVQMSDDLKDMRLMMMNQLGLVSDDEVKLKVGFDIDESIVDNLTDEQKEVVVKYLAEHEEVDDYTPEQKEALVKYIADGGNLDNYTPEEKQGIVKYLADGGDISDYTPEQKQAIVEYLTDSGDPDNWTPEQKEAVAKFKKDSAEVDNYSPEDKQAIAKFIKDSIEPDTYQPPNKTQNVTANLDSSEPDNYQPKDKKFTVKAILQKIGDWTNNLLSGGSKRQMVNGTANANGTFGRAFKQGDWRTKKTETALTGELGRELVVTGNRWYTVGDHGAEFATIPKGSIVFNHRQTEELFKNGKITSDGGRGRLLANGTAYASGTAYYGSSGSGGGITPEVKSYTVNADTVKVESETATTTSKSSSSTNSVTGKTYNKNSSSSSSSDTEEEFEETFDWVEIAISRIERAIDQLDQKANRTYDSWSNRNKALTSEISKVGDEIDLQNKAYNKYMTAANAVGLSSSWKKKVQNGSIDISTIKDEALAEKIKDYQSWYEKALECKDAIFDLQDAEAELYRQRFDNIQTQYDSILQGYEHTEKMLNEYISQSEERGYILSKKYYDALINNEKQNIAQLEKEQAALVKSRDEAVKSGTIKKYSQEWYDMSAEIDGVTESIEEGTTALIEYANAIRQIDWDTFDLIQERISQVNSEADFLIELMSNDKLFDDKGKVSAQGLSTMGLHGQKYNTYMYQADTYGEEIASLDKQVASGQLDGNSQDVINRRQELLELQWDSILAAEKEKDSIRDLVEESINLELDALSELIDKKNEALQSEKDLYEYQKKVKEQTEEISSLRKQMAAYEGDDSEEAKAKIQELRVSLAEAEESLEESEYDKYIQDSEKLLDTLYTEYELILNSRLDNIDALLENIIAEINTGVSNLSTLLGVEGDLAKALGVEGDISKAVASNANIIKATLNTEATKVGTVLSNAMKNIWNTGEGNAKSVLTMYGEDFKAKSTTTNAVLNNIKTGVYKLAGISDQQAQKKTTANKTSTAAKKDPTKTTTTTTKKPATTTTKKPATTTKSTGDGKAKVGDKVKFVSGQYYYDSEGKSPLGYHHRGENVYITSINTRSWATHPYHISTGNKLGKGDLGWLKLNQLSGYATGKKKISDNKYAWTQENGQEYIVRPSDGAILTPVAKGDSVLNATASGNIWSMANNPAEFIRDNLKLDTSNVPNGANVQNSYIQNFENITFSMPNVHSYDETIRQMQRDPKFEKLILAMTLDQVAGKSSLAKGKSIR